MDAKTIFGEKMPAALTKTPEKFKEVDAIYLFKVTGDRGGTWTMDLKADPPQVLEGEQGTADCTIELSDEDFETMISEPPMAMQLFFQGKIKISGDPVLATKLQLVLGVGQ
jgi:putative sterol carrier protein